jgi:hypothetical protein
MKITKATAELVMNVTNVMNDYLNIRPFKRNTHSILWGKIAKLSDIYSLGRECF